MFLLSSCHDSHTYSDKRNLNSSLHTTTVSKGLTVEYVLIGAWAFVHAQVLERSVLGRALSSDKDT